MNMRVLRSIAGFFVALCAFMMLFPQSVSAHAGLESSDPAPSSVLTTPPSHITLRFSESIEKQLMRIRLFDEDKREVTIGKAARLASDHSVAQADLPQLANGVYVVVWRVVSSDGHPISGSYSFEIGVASTGTGQTLIKEVLKEIDKSSNLGVPIAIARLFAFLGVVLLIGLVSVTWGSTLLQSTRTARLLQIAAVLLAIGSVGVLFLQGPYSNGGSWGDIFDANVFSDVMSTRLGMASIVRIAIAVQWVLLSFFIVKVGTSLWKNVVIVTSFVTLATFSLSGHPSAGDFPVVYIGVDALHLTAVSLWVGGVLALALLARREDISQELRRFSQVSSFAMPVAVLTGIAQALNLLPSRAAVTETQYGKYLIAKVALVCGIVLIGFLVRIRLRRDEFDSTARFLRRESLLVLAVVAATAFMVGESPTIQQNIEQRSYSATIVQKEIVGDFQVVPAKVGTSEVHAWFMPPGGMLAPVKDVKATIALPSRASSTTPVELVSTGPNHWSGIAKFPYAGDWTMEIRAISKDGEDLSYSVTVPISK